MKFMLSLVGFAALAVASAHPSLPLLHPGGIGGLFKGPNDETIIKGPDGSVITSASEGGEVHTKLDTIIVADEQPLAPVEIVPETKVVEIDKEQSSDLQGPSGRIITEGSKSIVAGPASTTISGPGGTTEVKPVPVLETVVSVVVPQQQVLEVSSGLVGNLPPLAPGLVSSTLPPPVITSSNLLPPGLVSSTLLPPSIVSSTLPPPVLSSTLAPPVIEPISVGSLSSSVPVQGLNPNYALTLNDHLNLGPQNQIWVNPTEIPLNNVIPPEIGLRAHQRPQLLTTPGLGAVGTNIVREESEVLAANIPNENLLLPSAAPQTPNIQTNDQIVNITPRNDILLKQNGIPTIEGLQLQGARIQQQQQHQVVSEPLLSQQILTTSSLIGEQQANLGFRQQVSPQLFTPTAAAPTLATLQQQELLSAQLLKNGIDPAQLQLTNVPLSAVQHSVGLNDGLGAEAWGLVSQKVSK